LEAFADPLGKFDDRLDQLLPLVAASLPAV
jgi:hypothetical protein